MLQVFLADQDHQVLQDLLVKMVSQDSLAPEACLALKVPLVRLVVKVLKVRHSPTGFHLVTALVLDYWVCLFVWFLFVLLLLLLFLPPPPPWFTGYACTLYTCEVQKDPESGIQAVCCKSCVSCHSD